VFPGDPACGLKAREAGSGALDAVYLIHAGEDLTPQQFDAASDRVAEFLMLDTVTPAGNLLEACRLEVGENLGLSLRSFGLYQLGFAHDKLLDASVNRICRAVVKRLSGTAEPREHKKHSLLQSGGDTRQIEAEDDPLGDLDQRAATLVRTMGLDVEPLMQVVNQFSAADLGGDPEAFFRKMMVAGPQNQPLVDKWLSSACDLFGMPNSGTSMQPQTGELSEALDERVGPWIAQVGQGLREWIEAIVEDPNCRVVGARRAAKWFQSYLKGLVDKLADAKARFTRETAATVHVLAGVDPKNRKAKRHSPQELASTFQLYCRLRMFELAAQRAGQIAHALQSHAVAAHDVLVDLQRDLDHLAGQFGAPDEDEATSAPASAEVSAVRVSVAAQLKATEAQIAKQIEEQISQSVFAKQGGLKVVMATGGEVRENLLSNVRTLARQAAIAKVQSIDLTSLLLANQNAESPLAKCLTEAQPWLQRCGGRRRLVFVIPQQLVGQYSSANLAAQLGSSTFKALPGVAPGTSSDLVLLFELGDISLPHVAANLIDFRRDLAEAASRLQTRCDVTWTPVFMF